VLKNGAESSVNVEMNETASSHQSLHSLSLSITGTSGQTQVIHIKLVSTASLPDKSLTSLHYRVISSTPITSRKLSYR